MASSGSGRATAVDFATYASTSTDAQEEIATTLRELAEAFGDDAIVAAVAGLKKKTPEAEGITSVLRGFCALVADSDRPALTIALVGKLVGMDSVTGERISLAQLATKHGISKQAASNRMKLYASHLNLPRPDQTEAARMSSRLTNRRNYGKRST